MGRLNSKGCPCSGLWALFCASFPAPPKPQQGSLSPSLCNTLTSVCPDAEVEGLPNRIVV